ncbi:hypothetical protein K435DRAFT_110990 [Dendrothele bispora CBS 962.96]|uniref:Uncharacterized protein n=1 Tax=Dendrothele bispora (strain CBS 962.96) TaxID=1314807 RepID=A0A4V4HAW3_DENBC|nr:hypothetical protein K435DRAFT_110990 [Dendrothele bispora CBS 962.96]
MGGHGLKVYTDIRGRLAPEELVVEDQVSKGHESVKGEEWILLTLPRNDLIKKLVAGKCKGIRCVCCKAVTQVPNVVCTACFDGGTN